MQVHIATGYDVETIRNYLHEAGYSLKTTQQIAKEAKSIPTRLISRQGDIHDFPSRREAAEYIANQTGKPTRSTYVHITDAINGRRKTVCGFSAENLYESTDRR